MKESTRTTSVLTLFIKVTQEPYQVMQLTNHSYLSSRIDLQIANAARKDSVTKLSTGSRMRSSKDDLGAISASSRLQTTRIQNFAQKSNLQNFHTFLRSQSEGIEQARRIYNRMNHLAMRVLDPTIGNAGSGSSGPNLIQ
jgi:flagellin-like hook-associated protein FlgL